MQDPGTPESASTVATVNWTALQWTVGISFLTLLVAFWLYRVDSKRDKRLPPGPRGLPFVGFLPFMIKGQHCETFRDWALTYGPIISFKMGVRTVVVLNDFPSIKTYLSKKEILDRSRNLLQEQSKLTGVSSLNGQEWVDNRRFCLHVFRDLGFGKRPMEELIKEECQVLLNKIEEVDGSCIELPEYLIPSMSNNVAALVFGSRYQYDDPKRKFLDECLSTIVSLLGNTCVIAFMPQWVHHLEAMLPFTRGSAVKRVFAKLIHFVRLEVKKHENTLHEGFNRDFIDGYLKQIKMHQNRPPSSFQKTYLVGNVLNFFTAGSNAMALSVSWHLLNFAKNPDTLQDKVYREIEEVVGKERLPAWSDHNRMPFTMATIWEMYRWKTITPLSLPREASEDTYFGDYFVPKGSIVTANLFAVHMDPKIWKNPEQFDPTRFLTQDGSGLMNKPEQIVNFSFGKRMCPAETLATVEVFLYLTIMLQNFKILPEEGWEINMKSHKVTFNGPPPQRVRFVRRLQ